jgi:hypothetical protein
MNMIKMLLVEDHSVVRAGLRALRSHVIWSAATTFDQRSQSHKRTRLAGKIRLLLTAACSRSELDPTQNAIERGRFQNRFDAPPRSLKTAILISWPASASAFSKRIMILT